MARSPDARGRPTPALVALAIAATAATLLGSSGVVATEPSASPGSAAGSAAVSVPSVPSAWPTADELRRELQLIGYSFRADRVAGEWLGWAPTFALDRPPSVRLGIDGQGPAWAAFEVDLLAVEGRAVDVEATMSALLEVLARLPVTRAEASSLFAFVSQDLLTSAPEQLEACVVASLASGVTVIRVDAETGLASLLIAQAADARDAEADLEGCLPLRPRFAGPPPGTLVSERLSVEATGAAFEPAEPTVEGSLVTVVLTFRNGASVDHTLTFDDPLGADSGLVGPGEERLLVLRRLEPGDYPFFSATDPAAMRGVLRVVVPPDPVAAEDPQGAEASAAP